MLTDDATVLMSAQFAVFHRGPGFIENAGFTRLSSVAVLRGLDPVIPFRLDQVQAGQSAPSRTGTIDCIALALAAFGSRFELAYFVPQLRSTVSAFSDTNLKINADTTDAKLCFLRDNTCIHVSMACEALFPMAKSHREALF